MCLGETRGANEKCKVSVAGAEGALQCMPGTARAVMGGRSYNPQQLEDSFECGIHYLCNLEKSVGEHNMFFAYQSGPAGDFSRPNPQNYDRKVREYIKIFEGAGDMVGSGIVIGVAPIDPGLAYVCSVWGEYRPSHPDIPHQGQDWCAAAGTPVKAPFDGIITLVGWSPTPAGKLCGGQWVLSVGSGEIGSLGVIRGCHMSSFPPGLKAGDRVKAGQVVAFVGATGDGKSGINTAGPHLHWQTEVVSSNRIVNGKVVSIKTTPYQIMAKWFDFSPYVAGTPEENPRYKGPMNPSILKRTAKFWHHQQH